MECAVKIKSRHRVVPSGGPVDSDVEVDPDGEALLPVVIILVETPGASGMNSCLMTGQRGSFVKKLVCSPSTQDMTALLK